MRAIASSTACSGLMPSVTTRWTALPQTRSCEIRSELPFVVADLHVYQLLPGQDLDSRTHAMWVARVEPERLLDQLAHRRHEAVAGEIQPMGEPAFLGKEADEVAGERGISAGLEDDGASRIKPASRAAGRWRRRASRWLRRSCSSRRAASCAARPGSRAIPFSVITTVWARNALLLPRLVQLVESGGVQTLRQIAV